MVRTRDQLLTILLVFMIFLLAACGSSVQATTVEPSPAVSHAVPATTIATTPTGTPNPAPAVAVPVRLVIPRIGVNAPVEDVGITSKGDLATPTKNPWDGVGWYSNGPRPGEESSAVINGHLDRPGGYAAVFWNLHNLRAGDEVMVVNAQGKTLHFLVTRLASYPPQEAPVQDIFSAAGGTFLGSGSHENGCPFKIRAMEKEVQTRVMHEQRF